MTMSREKEARYYWRVMRQINMLRRAGMAYPADTEDLVTELEVIVKWTEWPTLRRICLTTLTTAALPAEVLARCIA